MPRASHEAMKGRGIKYFQMKLKSNSYEFEYTEIEDLFKIQIQEYFR
jgi:hypothetical protein